MKLTYIAVAGLVVLVGAGVYLVTQNEHEEERTRMQADMDRKLQQLEKEQKSRFAEEAKRLKEIAEAGTANTAPASASPGAPEAPTPPPARTARTAKGGNADPNGVKKALQNVREVAQENPPEYLPSIVPDAGAPAVASEPPVLEPSGDERIKRAEDDLINGSGVASSRITQENARIKGVITEEDKDRLTAIQSDILAQPWIAHVGDARPAEKSDFIVLNEGLAKGIKEGDRFAVRRGSLIVARVVIGDTIQANQCVANIVPNTVPLGQVIKDGDEIIKFDR